MKRKFKATQPLLGKPIKLVPTIDFDRLRHRMKYAPFVLILEVPEWKTTVFPIRSISLN